MSGLGIKERNDENFGLPVKTMTGKLSRVLVLAYPP